jgi:hypothetical protein
MQRTVTFRALPTLAAALGIGLALALPAQASAERASPSLSSSPAHVGYKYYNLGLKLCYEARGDTALINVTAPAKSAAWAIGQTIPKHGDTSSFIMRWNGHRWRKEAMPVPGYQALVVKSSSPDNVWIFGLTRAGRAEVLEWDGHAWSDVAEPDIGDAPLVGEAVLGPSNAWLATQSAVYEMTGGIWTQRTLPAGFSITQLAGTSDRNLWIVGHTGTASVDSRLAAYRWQGSSWRKVRMPHPPAYYALVTTESARNVWVTNGSVILHWTAGKWHRLAGDQGAPPGGYVPYGNGFVPYGSDGIWFGSTEVWTGHFWLTVIGCDKYGYPFFGNGLAPIPGTSQTWMVGDSRAGSVIMRTYVTGP